MTYNWIFQNLTSKSINAEKLGFTSVQPNYPNVFNWTTKSEVTFNTNEEGPLIITFSRPVKISKYRILMRYNRRFPKGWDISVSYAGTKFKTIDSRTEDFCLKSFKSDANGDTNCAEETDRMFDIPRVTIRKIMLNLTIPGSCNTYDLHICAFDVYGTTDITMQCSCRCKKRSYTNLILVCLINY